MVVRADASLALEDLWHHVGSRALSFTFGLLGIVWLPLVPLLVLPSVILPPLFVFPLTLSIGGQMKDNVRAGLDRLLP